MRFAQRLVVLVEEAQAQRPVVVRAVRAAVLLALLLEASVTEEIADKPRDVCVEHDFVCLDLTESREGVGEAFEARGPVDQPAHVGIRADDCIAGLQHVGASFDDPLAVPEHERMPGRNGRSRAVIEPNGDLVFARNVVRPDPINRVFDDVSSRWIERVRLEVQTGYVDVATGSIEIVDRPPARDLVEEIADPHQTAADHRNESLARDAAAPVLKDARLTNPKVHDATFIHQIVADTLDKACMRRRMLVRRRRLSELARLGVDVPVALRGAGDAVRPVQAGVEPLR